MLKEERRVLTLEKALALLNAKIQASKEVVWATAPTKSFTIRQGKWLKDTYRMIGKAPPRDRATYQKIPDRIKMKELEALDGQRKELEQRLILARADLQVVLIEKEQPSITVKVRLPRSRLDALCERIDQEYIRIAGEKELTVEKMIYARIATASVSTFGINLSARQLEGKHKRWKVRRRIRD